MPGGGRGGAAGESPCRRPRLSARAGRAGAGCRVPSAECRVPGAGCRVLGAGCRVRMPRAACFVPGRPVVTRKKGPVGTMAAPRGRAKSAASRAGVA